MKRKEYNSRRQDAGWSCPGLLWLPMVMFVFLVLGAVCMVLIELPGLTWANTILLVIGGGTIGTIVGLPLGLTLLYLLCGFKEDRLPPRRLIMAFIAFVSLGVGLGIYVLNEKFFHSQVVPTAYELTGATTVIIGAIVLVWRFRNKQREPSESAEQPPAGERGGRP